MRDIFIGPLRHWLLFAGSLVVLWIMGRNQFHTTDFRIFLLVLFGLSVVLLGAVVATWREGERLTREPLDDTD